MAVECCGAQTVGREMNVAETIREVVADRLFYQKSGGGLTLTGGEPMAQYEFTRALLAAAKTERIQAALDTCGYAPWEEFRQLLPLGELFLYDFKAADPVRHRKLTGQDNTLILENLRKLDESGATIWLRCPLVPGVNDDEAHLAAIAEQAESLSGVHRVTIEPYHPLGVEKAVRFGVPDILQRREFTPQETAEHWRNFIALRTCKQVTIA